MARKRPRIGLALGGGGARGLAHLGVLKVLEAQQIPIDMIAGTSIGALIGAVYAMTGSADEVERRTREYVASRQFSEIGLELFRKKRPVENFFGQVASRVRERIVINLAASRSSLVGAQRLSRVVDYLLADQSFDQLRLPFVCIATDLMTGEEISLHRGPLALAVQASMSIPGFLPPVVYNGYQLVDGAVVAPVPVLACRNLGADLVIAVDVGQTLDGFTGIENVVDMVFRTGTITSRRFNHLLLEKADFVIRPRVGHVHWSQFEDISALVTEGERLTTALIPEIKRLVSRRSSLLRRWF